MDKDIKYSFLEKLFNKISGYIKYYKVPIVSAIFTALMAYMFIFTNKIINWDDLQYLFGKGGTLTSGRWGWQAHEWVEGFGGDFVSELIKPVTRTLCNFIFYSSNLLILLTPFYIYDYTLILFENLFPNST